MRIGICLAAFLLLSFVTGCSNKQDCFVADTIKEIIAQPLNDKGLRVYLRSSGLNDKEHFYEMYKGVPVFDDCGQPGRQSISQVHVDTSIGYPQKLIVKNNRLEIVYSNDESSHSVDTVPIEVE
ncbi:hypothetical protein [Candidatus Thiodiazotropha sp. CDECU1]|uniref:hypothetical protein n=1 Tax=Candidatus Thiodiazotropha sp. CDECU1 TaxID=3065865 RepID=UPI00292F60D4|nr:hypothetical protein [Candidatus Thiodiazotropha sp. CDECU1]